MSRALFSLQPLRSLSTQKCAHAFARSYFQSSRHNIKHAFAFAAPEVSTDASENTFESPHPEGKYDFERLDSMSSKAVQSATFETPWKRRNKRPLRTSPPSREERAFLMNMLERAERVDVEGHIGPRRRALFLGGVHKDATFQEVASLFREFGEVRVRHGAWSFLAPRLTASN